MGRYEMSLEKSRIPEKGNSSRKFIPEKQRKAMTDSFVERIARTRTGKGKMVSGSMVETRSQKSSEEQRTMLEVEVHPDRPCMRTKKCMGRTGEGTEG